MLKDVLKNLKQHCMSGISYMIPVIVIGGFCTALARLAGNVDTAGTIGYAFLQAGNAAFALMMSVLCAGIAYSICGKPGIAPGSRIFVNTGKSQFPWSINLWNLNWYYDLMDAGTFPRFKSFEINVSDRYLSGNIRNYSDAVDHVCLWTATCSINTGSC